MSLKYLKLMYQAPNSTLNCAFRDFMSKSHVCNTKNVCTFFSLKLTAEIIQVSHRREWFPSGRTHSLSPELSK